MKRKGYLDWLRMAAAFAVVVFHVMGSSVHNDPAVSGKLADILSRCKTMLGWPVPMFFMITGFLWLQPEKKCTFAKILPNIRRFVLVLFTIGYAYALMERVFSAGALSAQLFILSLGDVFTGQLWDHMWYLYAAIGVYLALPVLKPFFDKPSIRSRRILCALLWSFTILAPFLEESFGYHFPVDFPLGAPLFYVCTGGLLAGLSVSRRTGAAGMIVFLAGCILCAFGGNTSLLTSLSAPALFIAAKGLSSGRPSSVPLTMLAQCTFGIYLFQQFFINLIIKALHIYPLRYPAAAGIMIASLMVFLLSLGITALFRRISMIRKYLL